MAKYRCPLCEREMERDLILYLDHTQQHILDQIKREHPEWVESDGVCKPCSDYYQRQLSGKPDFANIGPEGRRRRVALGIGMLVVGLALALALFGLDLGRVSRLTLFVPFFISFLGFIQAREKTCAVLAEMGMSDPDSGQAKISDEAVVCRLKARGRFILVKSFLGALLLTALFFLLP